MRWLTVKQFSMIHQISQAQTGALIRGGLLVYEKLGGRIRVLDHTDEYVQLMAETEVKMYHIPIVYSPEVCQICKISKWTLNEYVEKGITKPVRRGVPKSEGRYFAFSVAEIQKILAYRQKKKHRPAVPRARVIKWAKDLLAKLPQVPEFTPVDLPEREHRE